jgi:tRNA(Ile2) C34 agmatinyltransferase TiaS
MDYWDEVEGHREPILYVVTCVACGGRMEVRADERGPYRCATCCEHDAERDQRRLDREVA